MTPELERALYRLWRAARKCDPALTDIAIEEPGRSIARAVEAVDAAASVACWPSNALIVGNAPTPETAFPPRPLGKNAKNVSLCDPDGATACGETEVITRGNKS